MCFGSTQSDPLPVPPILATLLLMHSESKQNKKSGVQNMEVSRTMTDFFGHIGYHALR